MGWLTRRLETRSERFFGLLFFICLPVFVGFFVCVTVSNSHRWVDDFLVFDTGNPLLSFLALLFWGVVPCFALSYLRFSRLFFSIIVWIKSGSKEYKKDIKKLPPPYLKSKDPFEKVLNSLVTDHLSTLNSLDSSLSLSDKYLVAELLNMWMIRLVDNKPSNPIHFLNDEVTNFSKKKNFLSTIWRKT